MNKKKIVLTFDYELFFGKKSGTIEKCLINPTNKLIEICDMYNIKTTFFIDVLFYEKLLEVNVEEAKKIENQLKLLIEKGHRIELHIHPHWLDACYKNGEWKFSSYRYYRIHNLDENKIVELFLNGKEVLENIAKKVDKNYNIIAFRAGGWCIQPFHKLKRAFSKANIKIDSSLAYGIKGSSIVHWFDFKNIPNKEFYFFENKVEEENVNGKFIEFPISTYKTNIFYKINRKFKKMLNCDKYKTFGDGGGIPLKRNFFNEIITYDMFALEAIKPKKLYELCKNYNKNYINIISHPKGLSQISFDSLEYIANKSEFEFINIYDFYREIKK